ncbi:MAG: hypothetical protein ACXWVJ_05375, partial [Caulobacteraceae bacterium]
MRTTDNEAYGWFMHPAKLQSLTFDGLNRDTAVAAAAGYDLNGNQTKSSDPGCTPDPVTGNCPSGWTASAGAFAYAYDVENRLTSATPAGGTAAV